MIGSLIPEQWITGLAGQEWALWLLSIGAMAALVVGADRAVGAAARLASALGLSKIIIGATIVSLGTTSPEATVSVLAAWRGNPGLALGNGIGSIICDTALIFGLCCVLKRLPLDRFLLNRQGWLQLASGVLLAGIVGLLWLFAGGDLAQVTIGRWVGVLLLLLLVGYMWLSIHWSRQHPQMLPDEATVEDPAREHEGGRVAGNLIMLALGLALVVGGSDLLVASATQICRNYNVPEAVIAGTFVAFGTSLPELVTALTALIKGHSELSIGNVIGADILNVLFVIGASATAAPLNVDPATFYLLIPTMLVVLVLFRLYVAFNRGTFKRWQGVPMLAIYAAYVLLSVLMFRTPG